jgi:hypothetical protein
MADRLVDVVQHLIADCDDGQGPALETRVLSSRWGTPAERVALPYTPDEANALLQVVEQPAFSAAEFGPQLAILRRLGWVRGDELVLPRPRLLEAIGARLYETLFPRGPVRTVLNIALGQARQARVPLPFQLHLDRDAGHLARLPWELVHDGQGFLVRSGRLAMARYIAFRAPATALALEGPLRVLVVVARPRDLPGLDEAAELAALREGLAGLASERGLEVEVLESPTWRAFVDALSAAPYHVVHFDGHGDLGRRCPSCRRLAPATDTVCRAPAGRGSLCGTPLDGVAPQGYLAFERPDGTVDWRSAENLAAALFRNPAIRLAVLSACRSAAMGQGSLFAGTAPALIGMGVPAVAAMQFQVPLYATVAFAEGFYSALARRAPLTDAMARVRAELDDDTWYRPTLYLRSRGDPRGVLFA